MTLLKKSQGHNIYLPHKYTINVSPVLCLLKTFHSSLLNIKSTMYRANRPCSFHRGSSIGNLPSHIHSWLR